MVLMPAVASSTSTAVMEVSSKDVSARDDWPSRSQGEEQGLFEADCRPILPVVIVAAVMLTGMTGMYMVLAVDATMGEPR